jgi:hypothetical protein
VNCARYGFILLFQQLAVLTSYGDGFSLYWHFYFIISVFKISGNSWNLTNCKLNVDNFEKQNCVNKTVPMWQEW